MKKIVSLLLVFAMLFSILVFASCGTNNNEESKGSTTQSAINSTQSGATTESSSAQTDEDPITTIREAFSADNIYEGLSAVSEGLKESAGGSGIFEGFNALDMKSSFAINKLDIGGEALVPSPLVLSTQVKSNQKAIAYDVNLSFLEENLGLSAYLATKSGDLFSDSTVKDGDLTAVLGAGDLYDGYIGIDNYLAMLYGDAEDDETDEGFGFFVSNKDIEKFLTDEELKKVASDLSAALSKALDEIPETAFEKSKSDEKYKDIYSFENADKQTLTLSEDVLYDMVVAFVTELCNNSTSELAKKIKDSGIEEEVAHIKDEVGDEILVITVISDGKASYLEIADDSDSLKVLALEAGSFYVDFYEDEENVFSMKKVSDGNVSDFGLVIGDVLELNAKLNQKDSENCDYSIDVLYKADEQEYKLGVSGTTKKTGNVLSGEAKIVFGYGDVQYSLPVTFNVESKENGVKLGATVSLNIPGMVAADISFESEIYLPESLEIAVPDQTTVTPLDDENMMEILGTIMTNFGEKCPNIATYVTLFMGSGYEEM